MRALLRRALVLPLLATLLSGPAAPVAAREAATEIRISAGFPERSRQYRGFTGASRRALERRHEGLRVVVEPRAISAPGDPVLERLAAGELTAAVLSAAEAAHLFDGALVYGNPFRFCGPEEIERARARFDGPLVAAMTSARYRTAGIIGLDSLYLWTDEPIESRAGLAERTLWLPARLARLGEHLRRAGATIRTFEPSGYAELPGWREEGSVYANLPMMLILDSDFPRPDRLISQPVSYTYFFLVVSRAALGRLDDDLQTDLLDWLNTVAGEIDRLNADAAGRSRDILLARERRAVPLPMALWRSLGQPAGADGGRLARRLEIMLGEMRRDDSSLCDWSEDRRPHRKGR